MKNLILICVTLFMSFGVMAKDGIVIKKSNIGVNGYSDITEKHTDNWLDEFQTHYLTCTNPGSQACKWENPPMTPSGSVDDIQRQVEISIEAGQLQGSLSLGDVTVNWSGQGVSEYILEIQW